MTQGDDARARFRILGPLVVDGAEVTAGRERTLLAMLLLRPGDLVAVGDLVDALWDDDPPATARAQVQTAVSRLRRRLPGDLIHTDPAGYAIRLARHDLDLFLFADHLAQARQLGGGDRERAAMLTRAALDLWRGAALAGVDSRLVRQRATALDEQHGVAVEEWADLEIAQGHDRAVLSELTGMVEQFPLRERLRGQLMTALNNTGRQADALAEFRRVRALFIDELGIEPGEELRRLHERILTGGSTAAVPVAGKPARVPRELPPEPRSFTARVHEVSVLDGLLDEEVPTTVVISAVSGTAGIGKTTLALHWGHRAAESFPDGQLYLNLRGYDADATVVRPEEALYELLQTLDIPARKIPPRVDAQSALLRSTLAGRRMLLVLDNARDAGQVRPLLPASPGCMAVVTSRAQLTGLVATAGAHLITLGLLSLDEARQMLAGRLGEHRLIAEPQAADRIIGACGHLPLALAIASARALEQPDRPLGKLAAELDDARLDALATGDPSADARVVFSWSYRALRPRARELFSALGLHPGPDFGIHAAAALLGAPVEETRAVLGELVAAHMVEPMRDDRWTFHDLLADYARERAAGLGDRITSLTRLVDTLVGTGHQAVKLRFPHRFTFPAHQLAADLPVERLPDRETAARWCSVERPTLVGAVHAALAAGLDDQAWKLTDISASILNRHAYKPEYVAVSRAGLTAAERQGDRRAMGMMNGNLGMALAGVGDIDTGRSLMERAAELFTEAGEQAGRGYAELELGTYARRADDLTGAVRHAQTALDAFSSVDDEVGQGLALNNLGWYRYLSGDPAGAIEFAERAILIHRRSGSQRGESDALDTLGVAQKATGDLAAAI